MLEFKDLVEIEPRLGKLLVDIQNEKPPTRWQECWLHRWYGIGGDRLGYKQKMMKLVGHFAEINNEILQTSTAYEIAYKTLCDALPECKYCRVNDCEDSPCYIPESDRMDEDRED